MAMLVSQAWSQEKGWKLASGYMCPPDATPYVVHWTRGHSTGTIAAPSVEDVQAEWEALARFPLPQENADALVAGPDVCAGA